MPKPIAIPPPSGSMTFKEWSSPILQEITRILTKTKLKQSWKACFHIDGMPPEFIAYYQQLQNLIAKIIPKEMNRPTIILQIRGSTVRESEKNKEQICLIGGTGPLSDAEVIKSLLAEASYAILDYCNIKLISAPPPRSKSICQYRRYIKTLKKEVMASECESYFLVSNTAHLNITPIQQLLLSYGAEHAKVIDNVQQIADFTVSFCAKLHMDSPKVLVLGTSMAAKGQLYTEKLIENNLDAVLPKSTEKQNALQLDYFGMGIAQEILQEFIDLIKRNEFQSHFLDKKAKNLRSKLKKTKITRQLLAKPPLTIGEALLDFIIDQVIAQYPVNIVLLACTELPLMLNAPLPIHLKQREIHTYHDLFIYKLNQINQELGHEEAFIQPVIINSEDLMKLFIAQELEAQIFGMDEETENIYSERPLLFSNLNPPRKHHRGIKKLLDDAKHKITQKCLPY